MIGVLIALVIMAVIGIGCLIWGIQWMQASARTVYGGSLPPGVSALFGADLQTQRIAIFMDNTTKLMVIVMEKTLKQKDTALPLSDPDVKKTLTSYDKTGQLQPLFQGSENGTPSSLKLDKQLVHTLDYTNSRGQSNVVGVLNLDNVQLAFVGVGQPSSSNLSTNVADFLGTMPIIQKDSHLH